MNSETVWTIPEPLSVCKVRLDADTKITVRRHGNPDGPRLVLSHGNGLAIDLYYPFWSLLAEDFDVIVYDLRNHGWNRVGSWQEHNIPILVRDLTLILDSIDQCFGKKPRVGIFHSVSALIALLASSSLRHFVSYASRDSFSGIVLFDPPLCRPGVSEMEFDAATERLAAQCRRRAKYFSTEEDFAELLSYSPVFTRLVPGTLNLYAKTTLRQSKARQGYELRCPPEFEAQICEYARTFAVMIDLTDVPYPTKVIGSDPTLPATYLPSLNFNDIFTINYDFVPETTHLLQLERPRKCVEIISNFLQSIGFK